MCVTDFKIINIIKFKDLECPKKSTLFKIIKKLNTIKSPKFTIIENLKNIFVNFKSNRV